VGHSLGLVVFIAVCTTSVSHVPVYEWSTSNAWESGMLNSEQSNQPRRLQRRVFDRLKDLPTSKPCCCPAGAGTVRWLEAGASAEEPLVGDGVGALVPLGGCGVAATVAGARPGVTFDPQEKMYLALFRYRHTIDRT
jgi:hypothetical protein